MNERSLRRLAAGVCLVAATVLARPTADDAAEFAAWFVRPATLPFAWNSFTDANQSGDAVEAFARGQRIMQLLPSWTDGYGAFAYQYALAAPPPGTTAADRAAQAKQRLDVAMAWLDGARATAGHHEPGLLQALAFLPEVTARQEPGLAELLRPSGGAAAIADRWFAIAEQKFPSAAVREQRTFFAPTLAAAQLAMGDRTGARAVLAIAIERSRDVRDAALATEWRQRLVEVDAWLAGEPVDLAAVRADARMEPLLPHLR